MFLRLHDANNCAILFETCSILRIIPANEHVGSGVFLQSRIIQVGEILGTLAREATCTIWEMMKGTNDETDNLEGIDDD